ncbi:hypothetical protein MRX96_059378 [Rhipicephalus microplus]
MILHKNYSGMSRLKRAIALRKVQDVCSNISDATLTPREESLAANEMLQELTLPFSLWYSNNCIAFLDFACSSKAYDGKHLFGRLEPPFTTFFAERVHAQSFRDRNVVERFHLPCSADVPTATLNNQGCPIKEHLDICNELLFHVGLRVSCLRRRKYRTILDKNSSGMSRLKRAVALRKVQDVCANISDATLTLREEALAANEMLQELTLPFSLWHPKKCIAFLDYL